MSAPEAAHRLRLVPRLVGTSILVMTGAAVLPSTSAAQGDVWRRAVSELADSSAGTFGDEGPRLQSALDALTGVLDRAGAPAAAAAEQRPPQWDPRSNDPSLAYRTLRSAREGEAPRGALDVLLLAYRRLVREKAAPTSFSQIRSGSQSSDQEPVLPLAAYAPGFRYLDHGDYRRAEAAFREAVAADPLLTDPARGLESMSLGITALRRGQLETARRDLETAVATSPRSSEAHRVLGLVLWAASRRDASVEQLGLARRLNPRNERASLALVRVLMDDGRMGDAEHTMGEILDAFPDSPLAHWWASWVDESLNRVSEARRHLELAVAAGVFSGRGRLWLSIGRLARVEGDFAAATMAFTRAVDADLDDAGAHRSLARAYLDQGRVHDALRELLAACLIDPTDAVSHAELGRVALLTGRPEDAVLALRRALELQPTHTEARYALATALKTLGQQEAAARELEAFERDSRQALAARRRDMALGVLIEEARLRSAEGRHDRAAALWQQVVDRDPDNPSNRLGLAEALLRAGRMNDAIGQYEAAATIEATPDVYDRLADLYTQVGRAEDSARAAARARQLRSSRSPQGSRR